MKNEEKESNIEVLNEEYLENEQSSINSDEFSGQGTNLQNNTSVGDASSGVINEVKTEGNNNGTLENVNETVNSQESKKDSEKKSADKKRKKIIIAILVVLILLGIGGGFAFVKYQEKIKNNDIADKDSENTDNEENKDDENKIIDGKPYSLRVYGITYNDGKSFMLCGEKGSYSYCNEEAFAIPVETEDAKILAYAYDNYVLYRDDKVYLYNDENGKSLEVNIDEDAEEYKINTFSTGCVRYLDNSYKEEKGVYGITFKKNGKATYYNLDSEKKLYGNKYSDIDVIDGELLTGYDEDAEKIYLLDANKNKVYLSDDTPCGYYSKLYSEENYFISASLSCTGISEISIYTSDYKTIAENVYSYYYDFDKKGYVFVGDSNNTIKKFDLNGKLINSYADSNEILSVYKDLYVIKKNDAIYIKEYSGNEYKLLDWKDEYYYHFALSRSYEEDELVYEEEKNSGYYFVFEYDGRSEGPGIEFYFNPETKEIKSYELEEIGGYAKPVLYLYPEEEMEVTVDFEHEENLTTTYPKFKDKWEVVASPNGDLIDKDGKYYYGLYWEENSNHRVDFSSGFYVTKNNAIEFLEEKLSIIGLNDRERNEFIMYWLPILEKNEQSLVYFELTEEREAFNKLEIMPKPDSLLRVAIHVKKVSKKVNIKEQVLIPFKRVGFSAIEWGGVLYN